MVLGITGGYCAGKSTYVDMLVQKGFTKIDVDKVGHQALQVHQDTIIATFGDSIVTAFDTINRKILGKIVFKNKKKLRMLESIVHPWMVQHITCTVTKNPTKNWVIDAALLYHLQLNIICDKIIIVKAAGITRFIRALRRDRLGIWNTVLRFTKEHPTPTKKKLLKLHTKYVETIVVRTSKPVHWEHILSLE